MPWTPSEFNERHLGGKATVAQARRGASAANSALSSCLKKGGNKSYCEGLAVRVGKATAKKKGKGQEMSDNMVVKMIQRKIFSADG